MTLYHYTCEHSFRALGSGGVLTSAAHLSGMGQTAPLQAQLVWLTDLDIPVRDALGLTMRALKCDRTAHRYRVIDSTNCRRWLSVRRSYPALRFLEDERGALPAHWWISAADVPVVYDPIRASA